MTGGENYSLTHVITGVHIAVKHYPTLSLLVSVDVMAGKSAGVASKTPNCSTSYPKFLILIFSNH